MNPRLRSLIALVAITFGVPSAQAQVRRVVTGGTFTPGGQVLFATDFSQDALGNFPAGLKYLSGPLEVVQLDGVHLLRSIGPAEFLIPLSQPLPQDFTLEFELLARNSNCCSGEELAFEGSPQLNRSAGSAWVAWHHQYLGIIGGGQDLGSSTVRFSEELQGELLGQRALIQVMMSGTQFKLFTNGRQVANVPNLVFRRSTVLRVYLGGLDDADRAVYLARVRLATSGATVGAGAQSPSSETVSQSSASTATPVPPVAGTTSQPAVTAVSGGIIKTTTPVAPAGPAISSGPLKGTTAPSLATSGAAATIASRTIALSGFTGAGNVTPVAPRTIALSGFIGTGNFMPIAPRTIALPGFIGTGNFMPIAPRTIALPGWTAVGLTINP